MNIIIAILIFGVIIAVHEFGHFIAAKSFGIRVNEFAIGMGPSIFKFKKGETQYSLKLFPIGGFCAMEGEDKSSEDNERAFHSKKVWQRFIVVSAGAILNIILGLIIAIILVSMYNYVPSTIIGGFQTDSETGEFVSSSNNSGLQINDEIISINGMKVFTYTDVSYKLSTEESDEFDLVVKRGGEKITLNDVVFKNTQTGVRRDFYITSVDKTPLNILSYATKDCISTGRLVWLSLIDLIRGRYGTEDLSGPVGTITVIGQAAEQTETLREKVMTLLNLTMLITINIGIFNLLPIPALDGGRLAFLFVEGIRRKPIKPEYEGYVHAVGMLMLFGFMIYLTFNDIIKIL